MFRKLRGSNETAPIWKSRAHKLGDLSLGVVSCPHQGQRPFLVIRSLDIGGKRETLHCGMCERAAVAYGWAWLSPAVLVAEAPTGVFYEALQDLALAYRITDELQLFDLPGDSLCFALWLAR